ncbi:MAG: hypothetical protein AAB740_05490 [Patescibacteria group bacterium]
MNLVKQKCAFCGKEFLRENGRYNEAKKFGWKQYCSLKCQYEMKVTQVKMECGNHICSKMVVRLKSQYEKSKFGRVFCSTSCAATVNNTITKIKSGKNINKEKICPFCSKIFLGIKKYCSVKCYADFVRSKPRVIKISKEQIIKEIQNFYQENDRIPVKREYSHYNATRDRFGNWNNAIAAAGFKPNPVLYAEKQVAKDGHKCDSLAEMIIDDWMFKNKIEHEREVFYPNSKKLKVDFVANGQWIEFFGLAGEVKGYNDVIKRKLAIIKKHKIPFMALYPKDIFPISRLDKIINVIQNPA